jgi:hypothetical protein
MQKGIKVTISSSPKVITVKYSRKNYIQHKICIFYVTENVHIYSQIIFVYLTCCHDIHVLDLAFLA